MKWEWVLEQIRGRDYWNESFPPASRCRFRRSSWPIQDDRANPWVWRIWQEDLEEWFHKKNPNWEKGWLQGWGGQVGVDDPERIMINGILQADGTNWHPSKEDLQADDWERI